MKMSQSAALILHYLFLLETLQLYELCRTNVSEKSVKVSSNRDQASISFLNTFFLSIFSPSPSFLQANCNSSGDGVQRKREVGEWG